MPLLALLAASAAAAGWLAGAPEPGAVSASPDGLTACRSPYHHDGDNIRCRGGPNSRLYGIDAPEMPGSCRPGRQCTPGDPYAARDYLASLTSGRTVECRTLETDHYGRPVVQCFADRTDLSCAMVGGGFAVNRYGALFC